MFPNTRVSFVIPKVPLAPSSFLLFALQQVISVLEGSSVLTPIGCNLKEVEGCVAHRPQQ